jgi:NAD+ dependent glucose-6-phosphate dehydrogenase
MDGIPATRITLRHEVAMPHILITGATGALGSRLRHHMQALGWTLTLLDRDSRGDPAIETVDLALFHDDWADRFTGVDTVIHLAGDPSPRASWASAQRNNIDLTHNVVEASCRAGVRRVVFASSNWVLAGHRFGTAPLEAAMEPYPVNPYGVSKLAGECIGRAASDHRGLSFIAFRIGYCQRDHDNLPGAHMGWGQWGQRMWLSNRDLCQGFEKAVLAPDTLRFGIFNLVSNNRDMRWRLDDAASALGYVPLDSSVPIETPEMTEETQTALDARRLVETAETLVIRRRW